MLIRNIHPESPTEIELVAQRMRLTLMEVLGPERGTALYSLDWLIERVRFHLDPQKSRARVLVADDGGIILGHCIVRVERDEQGDFGLFSTTYVVPEARGRGVAQAFLNAGEAWMQEVGLKRATTDTGLHNTRLIQLYEKHGYTVVFRNEEMLRLSRSF